MVVRASALRDIQAIPVGDRDLRGREARSSHRGWAGANAEIAPAIARLRDRSRDLVRNNPYAAKAVTALVSNMVGTGLLPRARAATPELAAQADRLWAEFASSADADGLTDFSGLQALIVRSLVESGEVLVRLRERRVEDGLPSESSGWSRRGGTATSLRALAGIRTKRTPSGGVRPRRKWTT